MSSSECTDSAIEYRGSGGGRAVVQANSQYFGSEEVEVGMCGKGRFRSANGLFVCSNKMVWLGVEVNFTSGNFIVYTNS